MSSSRNTPSFEITSHKFVERTSRTNSGRGTTWGEPRIYVFVANESVLDDLVARHSRPYNVWKKQIVPQALELLNEHMLASKTECYSWRDGDAPKVRWSQRAGCSCPCSPGFIVATTHTHDLYVDVDVTPPQQWGDVTKKVEAEIDADDAPVNVNPGVDYQTGEPITDEPTGFAIPAPPAAKRHDLTLPNKGRTADLDGSGIIFRIAGSENAAGYGIGGWDETGTGRLVTHGPLVRGPVAYLFGLAGVIDTNGGTGKIHADAVADGRMFDVTAGDVVVVNGIEFVLTVTARGYPKLNAVAALDVDAHLEAYDNDADYRALTNTVAARLGVPTVDPKIVRIRRV